MNDVALRKEKPGKISPILSANTDDQCRRFIHDRVPARFTTARTRLTPLLRSLGRLGKMATSGTSEVLSPNEDGIKVVCSRWAKDHGAVKSDATDTFCAHFRYRARLPFLDIERPDFYLGQIRARSAQVAIVVVRY